MRIIEVGLALMQEETPVAREWFFMKPYISVSFFFYFTVLMS
jgi:hypothetical protein